MQRSWTCQAVSSCLSTVLVHDGNVYGFEEPCIQPTGHFLQPAGDGEKVPLQGLPGGNEGWKSLNSHASTYQLGESTSLWKGSGIARDNHFMVFRRCRTECNCAMEGQLRSWPNWLPRKLAALGIQKKMDIKAILDNELLNLPVH